jgi:serine/threonine protein kinase
MIERVLDNWSNVHILTEPLGKGGQGIVYRTSDADIAVKLAFGASGEPITDAVEIKKKNDKFDEIRIRPIPKGLPLAIPLATLRGNAGYVMRLLSGLRPFSDFGFSKAKVDIGEAPIPHWCAHLEPEAAKRLVYYQQTGGLRRRLSSLSQCAAILARLHAAGLVYADVSPNNVFVSPMADSSKAEQTTVWFIDADNLRYEGANYAVLTPGYAAPEVAQGTGCSSCAGDAYSFAVMAFWMLTLQHPFLGRLIDDDDDDEPGNSAEEKAYSGLFPFVDDPDDDSNAYEFFPRSLFLNAQLASLFEDMFCAGRNSPDIRPPAMVWAFALAQAADQTLVCPSCGMSYYYTEPCCPYCDAKKPPHFIARSCHAGTDGITKQEPCWTYVHELSGRPVNLPQRLFTPFFAAGNDNAELEWRYRDEGTTDRTIKGNILMEKTNETSLDISFSADTQGADVFRPLSYRNIFPSLNFRLSATGSGRIVTFMKGASRESQ